MKLELKKLVLSAMFVAITVALSNFSIPIGASKCYPIQHLMNVMSAVFFGPFYGVMGAFVTSLIRNFLGTGSLLAFPGSMVGAFLAGIFYQYTKKLYLTYAAEIFGTGVLGGMLSYPIAMFIMGKEAAIFTYVVPFLMSTVVGTMMAAIIVTFLEKTGNLGKLKQLL